ncbi:MAG: hypothetical protein L6W00_01350 [Lentisphaeria bacterium]|nr:MAG: hypothetical protein L6W00_01350 [Lentisphaeria bacterium]
MKKILSALLASTGLFCSAGTARIDLISGNAGLRVVSTAAGVSGKNMNWLPPEKGEADALLPAAQQLRRMVNHEVLLRRRPRHHGANHPSRSLSGHAAEETTARRSLLR